MHKRDISVCWNTERECIKNISYWGKNIRGKLHKNIFSVKETLCQRLHIKPFSSEKKLRDRMHNLVLSNWQPSLKYWHCDEKKKIFKKLFSVRCCANIISAETVKVYSKK